jgi:hypothetical protein
MRESKIPAIAPSPLEGEEMLVASSQTKDRPHGPRF